MAQPTNRTTEYFPPTDGHGETRDETLERLVEDERVPVARADIAGDPTTRRGKNTKLVVRPHIAALIGAGVGTLVGLLLALIPGVPGPGGGVGGGQDFQIGDAIGYMVVLAIAVAAVTFVIAGLIYVEREDGRMEREAEERTGHPSEPPAAPLDPKHDV